MSDCMTMIVAEPNVWQQYDRIYIDYIEINFNQVPSRSKRVARTNRSLQPNNKHELTSISELQVKPSLLYLRFVFTDVDECSASIRVCANNATCQNTNGSYACLTEGIVGLEIDYRV